MGHLGGTHHASPYRIQDGIEATQTGPGPDEAANPIPDTAPAGFYAFRSSIEGRGTRLLEQILSATHGETYILEGVTYRRHDPPTGIVANTRARIWAEVIAAEKGAAPPVAVGKRADITGVEATDSGAGQWHRL